MALASTNIGGITLARTVFGDFLLPADGALHTEVRETGGHARSGLAMLATRLGPGHTVLDLGAGVGMLAVPLQHIVQRAGCVWCFEPDPAAFTLLRWNLALNGVDLLTRTVAGVEWPLLDDWCRRAEIERVEAVRVHGPGAAAALVEQGLETVEAHRPLVLLTREFGDDGASPGQDPLETELRRLGYSFLAGAAEPQEGIDETPAPPPGERAGPAPAEVLAVPEEDAAAGIPDE